jgi:hypothetical protein
MSASSSSASTRTSVLSKSKIQVGCAGMRQA